jgi:hypothetical protein
VRGADDCIYGIPSYACRVVKFNPVDNSLTEIGPDLGAAQYKWHSGVLADNGCIYCIPSGYGSEQFLKIDTINGTVTLLDVRLPETSAELPWATGALAIDGCIYFMPDTARHILKLNPENDSVAIVGDHLRGVYSKRKYVGTVVGKDSCLYGIPCNSKRIVRFNPVDQSISFVGDE